MDTLNFYKQLPVLKDFYEITEDKNYHELPSDWYVLVSDIKGSTKAIDEGKYKQINMIGAMVIVGILNIEKNSDLPYIFGGDGAAVLIPKNLLEQSKKVLLESQKKAKEYYDLTLRVGILKVEELNERGYPIEITKFAVSKDYTQAVIRGGGVEKAEEILKAEENSLKIKLDDKSDYEVDFSGLECRWENIPSPKDETLSVLIKSLNTGDAAKETYKKVLTSIGDIAGHSHERHPIKKEKLVLSLNPKVLNYEASLRAKNFLLKSLIILKLMLMNVVGIILLNSKNVLWKDYKDRVLRTTDTEKFDDMLRMVISTNEEQTEELEEFLEEEFKNKHLVYGIHKSDSALMTCLIFERHGKHVHFVDSSNGGYAMASKSLKKRLSQL